MLYSDTFNRRNASSLGSVPNGPAWVEARGSWEIRDSAPFCLVDRATHPMVVADFGSAKFDETVDASAGDALVGRYVDANNWLRARITSGSTTSWQVIIDRCINGAITSLAASPVFTAWQGRLRFRGEGTALTAYRWERTWFGTSRWVQAASANVTTHAQSTLHGFGRAPSGRSTGAIDNFTLDTLNDAPYGPTLTDPGPWNREQAGVLSWTFNDPNPGDAQSAFELQHRASGTTSWTTTGKVASTLSRWAVAAGTFPEGDREWRVKTWDRAGDPGPFSQPGFFTASNAPAGPVVTTPGNESTVSSARVVLGWSSPDQEAYEVKVTSDAAGSTVVHTSGVQDDATAVSTRSYTVPTPDNGVRRYLWVRVRNAGLWSTWATVAVNVSYTPPAVPALTITPLPTSGAIMVTPNHPTPTGSQPEPAYNVLRARVGLDGEVRTIPYAYGPRTVEAPPGADIVDYTPTGAPAQHWYQLETVGANDTSIVTDWYAETPTTVEPTPEPDVAPSSAQIILAPNV